MHSGPPPTRNTKSRRKPIPLVTDMEVQCVECGLILKRKFAFFRPANPDAYCFGCADRILQEEKKAKEAPV